VTQPHLGGTCSDSNKAGAEPWRRLRSKMGTPWSVERILSRRRRSRHGRRRGAPLLGSLVTSAEAKADAILEVSRNQADQAAADLARAKEEQAAELDRERDTTLAELSDEKTALEAQIATLRQMEGHHRSQLRHHLTEQLSLLDAPRPEPPAVFPR